MKRIWSLLVALSKDWLRNREAVFFAFLFPVLLLLIFSTVFGGGAAQFTLHVQNNDLTETGEPTNLSASFVDALNETEALSVRSLDADRNVTTWHQESRASGTPRVVVIPDGFADQVRTATAHGRETIIRDTLARAPDRVNNSNRTAVRQGANATLNGTQTTANGTNATSPAEIVFLSTSDDDAAPAIRGILESIVAEFNERALGVDEPPTTVSGGDLGSQNVTGVDYYLPGLIAAVVMINGVITLPAMIAGFNADGTLKRLVATPLRKRDWILAHVIQQALLAVLATGVMVLVAHLVFDVTVIPGLLSIALILLGAFTFAGLGMVLGTLVRSSDAATSLGMGIALPMMFVSGVFWELELMPDYLQTVATLLPIYYFHRGLRQLMVLDTTDGIILPFAILGVGAILSLFAAIYVTNWQDF